ncbi:hypothetical protein [Streptomyces sp. NBC_01766]|uniref:hypothetical protein n=1 Tax=Streptomyces sp. NBC_01766 TaxID=2975936 RepID=UPI002DDB39B6|nr:hypothetical protein [Streptomyces sp. NBC_01766]WSC18943.1 hypothetical protein OIE60_04295 [Streptomyces sp. NBC_01766]
MFSDFAIRPACFASPVLFALGELNAWSGQGQAAQLPLPVPVWDALRSFKSLQAKEKLALGPVYLDSGYVLVDEMGEARNIKQLRRRAYRIMSLLGLRQVRLYDARAYCFTYLANMGVPDHLLARWAGHTDVLTTKRWYVKPGVEDLRGAAAVWGGLHGSGDDIPRGRERLCDMRA